MTDSDDLLTLGPMLVRYSPELFKVAATMFFRIRFDREPSPTTDTVAAYIGAIRAREDRMVQQIPKTPNRFPWNKPEPMLRQQQKRIEEFLAPLSDRRQKAYLLTTKAKVQP